MSLIAKISVIQCFLLILTIVTATCPYARMYNDEKEHYLFAKSYDTYDTVCHHLYEQPPTIPTVAVDHALHRAINRTKQYVVIDDEVISSSNVRAPQFLMDNDRSNYFFETATKYVTRTMCVSKNTTVVYLPNMDLDGFDNKMLEDLTQATCEQGHITYPRCTSASLYSKVDGTCNNLKNPLDGSVGDCMRRLLPPDYSDGVSQIRVSIDGSPLPNPRIVSTKILGSDDKRPLSKRYTQVHAFFGEFVISDNGMTLSNNNGMSINMTCCERDGEPRLDHPQCHSFFVPPGDDLNNLYPNQKCMEFVRTIPCPRCRMGPRMISNSVTAPQDLNSVYGVSTIMTNARRTKVGGLLVSEQVNGQEVFAVERFNASGRFRCFNGKCELSPLDVRNLQFPTGLAWALIFHRNHNVHARKLAAINPQWNDEKLFYEARKLNIAQYQHCVYKDYLKTLIGDELAKSLTLLPLPSNQFSKYNSIFPLKTIIEFQTTAGRAGHAALSEEMTFKNEKNGSEFSINMRYSEKWENVFYDGIFDGLFAAQMDKAAYETTPSVPFKTFLFDVPGRPYGLDLAALDIQRNRDHGVPAYVNYVKYCHDIDVNDWADLSQFIDSDKLEVLKSYYKYVGDVDLYVGGHYERHIENALVGPTFGCLIGKQFHDVKFGDRFFYEHGNQISSFSVKQLNDIKTKSSLASILCKNTKLDKVSLDPLRLSSDNNQFVSCSTFRDIDYTLWADA